jgi:hypothetical protein
MVRNNVVNAVIEKFIFAIKYFLILHFFQLSQGDVAVSLPFRN